MVLFWGARPTKTGLGVIIVLKQKRGPPAGKEGGELDLRSLSLAAPSCEAARVPRPAL